MELQLYTPYRVPTVGPPCFVPLRNRGSSLLRRRSRRNRLAICLFGPCTVPSPRLLPLRLSSGGFEQLRPSLGLLRNSSSSLAAECLRRWPSLHSEGGVPNIVPMAGKRKTTARPTNAPAPARGRLRRNTPST